jgi:uncharacterized protein YdcH (DUF465 family)
MTYTFDEFTKLLEKKHDTIQDEITTARKEQQTSNTTDDMREAEIRERIAKDRLRLIDWIIGEANKVEKITKPKMREFI